MISDFISAPGWERALEGLTRKHEVIAVRLYDRREIELPDVGPVLIDDAETGEQLVRRHARPRVPAAVRGGARARGGAGGRVPAGGVDAVALATDDDLLPAIVRMAARRKRTKR